MGIFIKKSKNLGPLRGNLSKSGIGASVGITGFRIGVGPKGNYLHAGRKGIYYRSTLKKSTVTASSPAKDSYPSDLEQINENHPELPSDEVMIDLLNHLNHKQKTIDLLFG